MGWYCPGFQCHPAAQLRQQGDHGAENAGIAQDSNVIPQLSCGSKGIMERSAVQKQGITFGAENAGIAQSSNVIPQLSCGSKGIMERSDITKPGITFGADVGN